jgi:hypothetical protein
VKARSFLIHDDLPAQEDALCQLAVCRSLPFPTDSVFLGRRRIKPPDHLSSAKGVG